MVIWFLYKGFGWVQYKAVDGYFTPEPKSLMHEAP